MAFVVEEETGSRRVVTLKDRTLPYRGPKWEAAQRNRLEWYAGNPVGTLQVLGAQETPTTINGMWKDKFLAGNVEVSGFPQPATADDLVKIFEDILRSGNRLRVQWETFVRNGILARFSATPERIEDIAWQAEFVWFGRDDQEVPRATADEDPTETLLQSMNAVDDQLAFEPSTVDPGFADQAQQAIASIREQTTEVFDRVREINSEAAVPGRILGAIGSAADNIRSETEAELTRLLNTPAQTLSALDFVVQTLKLEQWKRNQAKALHDHRANVQRVQRDVVRQFAPGAIGTVTVRGTSTLRDIAVQVYGTPDAWQQIADFNNIVGSIVDAGTVLALPQTPQQRGVRTDGNIQTERAGQASASC